MKNNILAFQGKKSRFSGKNKNYFARKGSKRGSSIYIWYIRPVLGQKWAFIIVLDVSDVDRCRRVCIGDFSIFGRFMPPRGMSGCT
jgi:hypothetical protein